MEIEIYYDSASLCPLICQLPMQVKAQFPEKFVLVMIVAVLLLASIAVWRSNQSGLSVTAVNTVGTQSASIEHLLSIMESISTGVAGNFLFFIFGVLAAKGNDFWRSVKRRRKVAAANSKSFATSALMVISGSRYELTNAQIIMRTLPDQFRIEIPPAFVDQIRESAPTFVFNKPVVTSRIAQLILEVKNLEPRFGEILDTATAEVAKEFIMRAQRTEKLFNGKLFHVLNLGPSATIDEREDPIISADFYEVDYFTHQVVNRAFRHVKKLSGTISAAISAPRMINELRFFLNGFGLCCLVCAVPDRHRPLDGAVLVFGRRSERVAINEATGKWHVTANEALSQTDVEDQRISVDRWIRRALHEEVGIVAEAQIIRSVIFNAFIAFGEMQPGMCCLSFCEVDLASLESKIIGSQDGAVEYDAYRFLPFDDREISQALNASGMIHDGTIIPFSPASENILRNILARGTKSFA